MGHCATLQTHKADPARRSQSMGGTALQGALAAQLKQLDPAGRHHQEPSLDHLVTFLFNMSYTCCNPNSVHRFHRLPSL